MSSKPNNPNNPNNRPPNYPTTTTGFYEVSNIAMDVIQTCMKPLHSKVLQTNEEDFVTLRLPVSRMYAIMGALNMANGATVLKDRPEFLEMYLELQTVENAEMIFMALSAIGSSIAKEMPEQFEMFKAMRDKQQGRTKPT